MHSSDVTDLIENRRRTEKTLSLIVTKSAKSAATEVSEEAD